MAGSLCSPTQPKAVTVCVCLRVSCVRAHVGTQCVAVGVCWVCVCMCVYTSVFTCLQRWEGLRAVPDRLFPCLPEV